MILEEKVWNLTLVVTVAGGGRNRKSEVERAVSHVGLRRDGVGNDTTLPS